MVIASSVAPSRAPAKKTGVMEHAQGDCSLKVLEEMQRYAQICQLKAEERAWLGSIIAQNPFFGPLDRAVEALASCPKSFRLSPDYGVMAGMICAKFILEDRAEDEAMLPMEQKKVTPALLEAFLKLCEPWTCFPPYACYYLLACLDPKVIFAMLVVWPSRWTALRPFFLGVLKGFLIFPPELDEAWTDDMLDVLDTLTASHRRPAHDGPSLF